MNREKKEIKKKAGQALIIAEFPQICREAIHRKGPEYDPSAYWRLVELSNCAIISNLGRYGSPPEIRKEWKTGLEVELKGAWDTALTKIKEETLKIAREKIPRVCVVMINVYCEGLLYPELKEPEFERFIRHLHFGGGLRNFQDSWKEDLREDVTKAWTAEVEKAKADGRIPKTLDDAYQLAWAYMESTKPFAHHKWITTDGLVYALTNLIMGYPRSIWLTWTEHGPNAALSARVIPEEFMPADIKEKLQALYKEINARGVV